LTISVDESLQLVAKELYVNGLRDELTKLKSNHDDQLKEIEEVNSVHSTLTQELDKARSRLSLVSRDLTTAEATIDDLKQQLVRLNDLREQAGRVPNLVLECEVNTGVIVNLQEELDSLKVVNRKMNEQRIDAEIKATEISKLKLRLQMAEAASQQLPTLQEELQKYEEQIRPLIGAQKRADLLESELQQTNDRVAELDGKVTGYNYALEEIDNLRKQLGRRRDESKSMKKSLKAAEKEAAGTPVLENEVTAQKHEIGKLKQNLGEAKEIYAQVQQMEALLNQYPERFSILERGLKSARQTAEALQSTKAAYAELQRTVVKLQEEAAVVEQASDSLQCLSEEMQGKNAQIVALRNELSRLQIDLQGRKEVSVAETEDFLQADLPQETRRLAEDGIVRLEADGHHTDLPKVESQKNDEPCKHANRSTSKLKTNPFEPVVTKTSSEDKNPRRDSSHQQEADDEGSHAPLEKHLDEISVVPESQPPAQDSHQSSSTKSMRDRLAASILISSPLSDIGELFDPSDTDRPAESLNYQIFDSNQSQQLARMKPAIGEEDSPLNDNSRGPESQQQTNKLQGMNQGSGPPSSSYGEPLLLDDLEGVGSLPANGSTDIAPDRESIQSTQDILTSPIGIAQGKLSRQSIRARTVAPWLSISVPEAADPIEHSQYSANNPSPRRLREKEPASQTSSRQPLQDLGYDSQHTQPATPRSPVKEKNRPNSAIKRKSEAGGVGDEAEAPETKRAKRNLSNMEIADRRGTASQSLGSSTSDTARQPLTRLRQSSSSSTRSRSTIVGKNAPAPGNRNQGPKKPRGGSKSEECLIITISRGY
jgi:chromosome segregation ATPase